MMFKPGLRGARRATVSAVVFAGLLGLSAAAAAADVPAADAAFEREDYAAALAGYEKPANDGLAHAQYRLGMMYRFGWGVEKDFVAARQWFERAAEQDHAAAQSELGKIHKDGRGVPRDRALAVKWFERAAYGGEGVAALNLGRMYMRGRGVEKNFPMAHAWFSIAIGYQYMDAMGHRNRLEPKMSEAQIAKGKALAKEMRAKAASR